MPSFMSLQVRGGGPAKATCDRSLASPPWRAGHDRPLDHRGAGAARPARPKQGHRVLHDDDGVLLRELGPHRRGEELLRGGSAPSTPHPPATLPPQNISKAYQYLTRLAVTDPLLYANFTADISAWMLAETYAPQQVDILPFPIKAYTSNAFYSSVAGLLPFFLVIATLFPVTRLISSLVAEKETKIREGMRMMGLSDAALLGSWYVMYAIIFFIIAVIISIMTRPNMWVDGGFGRGVGLHGPPMASLSSYLQLQGIEPRDDLVRLLQ